jgi:beta/gamma crystallin
MKMKKMIVMSALLAAGSAGAQPPSQPQSPAQAGEMILYEQTNYNGDSYPIDRDRPYVKTTWNIRSIAIHPGEKWQICAKPRFQGDCIVLPRSVNDAKLIGVMGQIGSTRRAKEGQ